LPISPTADPETARDLANTLMLNQGFEELTKKSLLARFIKIFPKIQSLVCRRCREQGRATPRLPLQLRAQARGIRDHRLEKIPENSKAIATAREHGDLKENSEYKMAKQDQQVLMGQKTLLEKDLGRARITDFKEASTDQVSVGSIVEVRSGGAKTTDTLLGVWDGDPDKHILSYKTPMGAALLGKKAGDSVKVKTGNSEDTYEIVSIARYVDSPLTRFSFRLQPDRLTRRRAFLAHLQQWNPPFKAPSSVSRSPRPSVPSACSAFGARSTTVASPASSPGLGAATADTLYGLVAAFSISASTDFLVGHRPRPPALRRLLLFSTFGLATLRARAPAPGRRPPCTQSHGRRLFDPRPPRPPARSRVLAFVGIFAGLGVLRFRHVVGPGS